MKRARKTLAALAVLGLAAIAWRACSADTPPGFALVTLPQATSTRFINRVLPESTGALLAAHLLALPPDGGEELTVVLEAAYARMERAIGSPATPAIATYLGAQRASAFDAIVIDPERAAAPTSAMIFLHGFAGSFDVYCWQVSLALVASNTLLVCPSIGPRGDWWQPHGLATVRATLEYLHARGIERVVLAGLSNGGAGAGVIAKRLEHELHGVVLISGTPARGAPPKLPLLIIQGERDGMMPAANARSYASRARAPHEYVALPGGHFIVLSQWQRVNAAVERWLVQRLSSAPARR